MFKPTRPAFVDDILKNYSKKKNPYFFKYAKGKIEDKCEKVNNSTVNEITKNINDRPLRFDVVRPMAKVDYKVFLGENASIDRNSVIIIGELYDKLNKSYGSNLKIVGSKKMNEVPILNYLHEKMDSLGYSREEIINSLVIHLYKKQSSKKKKLLWSLYGDVMIDNLKRNLNTNKVVCMRCGKRVDKDELKNNKCRHCREKEIKETKGMKILKCIDCGEEFEVGSKSRIKVRCDKCQAEETKRRKRENWRKNNKLD